MFYDVNVSLFPLALMHNKNPYSSGLEKEGFCLFPRLPEAPRQVCECTSLQEWFPTSSL